MNKILLIITGSIAASRCKEIIALLNINEVKVRRRIKMRKWQLLLWS